MILHITANKAHIHPVDNGSVDGIVLPLSDNQHVLIRKNLGRHIDIFNLETGKIISNFEISGPVEDIVELKDGKHILIGLGGYNATVEMWNLENKESPKKQWQQDTYTTENNRVWLNQLLITADGQHLITSLSNAKAGIWQIRDDKIFHVCSIKLGNTGPWGSEDFVLAITKENILFAGGLHNGICAWNLKNVAQPRSIVHFYNHSEFAIHGLNLSPDDKFLISSHDHINYGDGHHLVLWDIANIGQHTRPTKLEEISSDQSNLIMTSDWNLLSGNSGKRIDDFVTLNNYQRRHINEATSIAALTSNNGPGLLSPKMTRNASEEKLSDDQEVQLESFADLRK